MTIDRNLKRIGALSILSLVLLAGGGATAYLVSGLALSQQEETAKSLQQLARYRAEIDARAGLEAELKRLKQQSATLPGLVPGASAPLAAANIQSEIKFIVGRNGGEIRSSQNLPPATINGFEKIEITYDIALPADHLKDLVYQIESHTPYFFLDGVSIQTAPNAGPQASDRSPPRLEIRWIVRGYRSAGA